jgi:hypothetical protein
MTINVTMIETRMGAGGVMWTKGETYAAEEPLARQLVADNVATATFPETFETKIVTSREVGDGYEIVIGNAVASQLTGAWDDLRFPAQGINPAGAADAPAVDNVLSGFPGTLLFAGNQENVIAGVAQMPHAWRAGSAIRPHIHWSKPVGSASAVAWEFYHRQLGFPSDVAAAWVGPIAGTIAEGTPTVADSHIITSFGEIAMTGKRESSCICWQIRRQGGTDADNGTARLYEFDIHYLVDKQGTSSEIPAA